MGSGVGRLGLGLTQFVAGPVGMLMKGFMGLISIGTAVIKMMLKLGVAVSAIAVGSIIKGLKTFANYEEQMIRLRAMTGATGDEWIKIEGTVRKVIKESEFMPKAIAQAAVNLAALGVQTSSDFAKLMPQVRNFSTILGTDINEGAEILLATMKQFGKEADDAADVVEVFTNAFVSSAANATRMRNALKYIGFEAGVDKQDLRDVATLISLIVDRGKEATQAGTGLRNVFLTLQKGSTSEGRKALEEMGVSLEEVKGSATGYLDILKKLADAGMNADQAAKIFNIRGLGVARVLVEIAKKGADGTREIDKMRAKMDQTGVSQKLLGDLTEGLGFKWDVFKGSLENAFLELGNLVNRSRDVKGGFDNLTAGLNDISTSLSKISGESIRDLISALKSEFTTGHLFDALFEGFIAGLELIKPWVIYLAKLFGATLLRFIQVGYEKIKEAIGMRDSVPGSDQTIMVRHQATREGAIEQWEKQRAPGGNLEDYRKVMERWLKKRGLKKDDYELSAEYEEGLLGDYWKIRAYPKAYPWMKFPQAPTEEELGAASRDAGERWRRAGEAIPEMMRAFREILRDIRENKPYGPLSELDSRRGASGSNQFNPAYASPAAPNIYDFSLNNNYGTGRAEGLARPKTTKPDPMMGGR